MLMTSVKMTGVLAIGLASLAATTQPATSALEGPSGRTVEAREKHTPYKPQPTLLLVDLPGFTPTAMPELDAFGGVLRYPRSKATGFFRTEKIDGRWWFIDPQGYRMIEASVASVNIGKLSPDAQRAFDAKFATQSKWADFTRSLLHANGFDSTGAWSDDDLLKAGTDHPPVRAQMCSFMGTYALKHGDTLQEPGHTGFPNKCIFVFEPDFADYCDNFAKSIAATKNDPYLLGYFSDNEIPFPLDALDRFLTLTSTNPGRQAADAFVAEHHVNTAAITDKDRQAWIAVMADRYFKTVSEALRKYDPNHLYLGTRLFATDHRNAALLQAAGKYADVLAYNLYGVWTPKADNPTLWTEISGRPILISEFYAKAEDSGLANTDGGGWLVHTQADRGAFYQNFTIAMLECRTVVGWQWFKYVDNDPKISAGANPNDSNKGILSATFVPYDALLSMMKQMNDSRYAVADYFDQRATKR